MNSRQLFPYLISFILLAAVLIIDRKTNNETRAYSERVEHTRMVIMSLERLSDHIKSAEIFTPNRLNAEKQYYGLYQTDALSIPSAIKDLKKLVADNPQQLKRINAIDSALQQLLPALMENNISELISKGETWRLHQLFALHQMIIACSRTEVTLLNIRKNDLESSTAQNRFFSYAFSILAFSLTIGTLIYNFVLVRRRTWLQGFLESVLNTSQNGIMHFKAVRKQGKVVDFKLEFANAAIENLLGLKLTSILGKNVAHTDLVGRDTGQYKIFEQVLQTGEPAEFEMYYDRHDRKAHFFIMLAKMEDGLTITLQNITEIRRYQDELTRNIQQLELSNNELEQYAYVASHDLQEPLRKIRTYGSFLQDSQQEQLNEKGRIHLSKIIQSAERLSNLIKDILNFSSLKRDVVFAETDLNTVLSNVLEDVDVTAEQNRAQIKVDKLPVIEAIPLQMNQLFYNLIVNAIKFKKEDEDPVINITSGNMTNAEVAAFKHLDPKLSYCCIIVKDNGIGFNPEFNKQIFGLFKRLNDQRLYPGSGIGLALCSKVVANHQGEIHAVSKAGHGAAFHVILPYKQKQ